MNSPGTGAWVGLGNGVNGCVSSGFGEGCTFISFGPVMLAVELGVKEPDGVEDPLVENGKEESGMDIPVEPNVPEIVIDVAAGMEVAEELDSVGTVDVVVGLEAVTEGSVLPEAEVDCDSVNEVESTKDVVSVVEGVAEPELLTDSCESDVVTALEAKQKLRSTTKCPCSNIWTILRRHCLRLERVGIDRSKEAREQD